MLKSSYVAKKISDWPNYYKENESQEEIKFCGDQHYDTNGINWS